MVLNRRRLAMSLSIHSKEGQLFCSWLDSILEAFMQAVNAVMFACKLMICQMLSLLPIVQSMAIPRQGPTFSNFRCVIKVQTGCERDADGPLPHKPSFAVTAGDASAYSCLPLLNYLLDPCGCSLARGVEISVLQSRYGAAYAQAGRTPAMGNTMRSACQATGIFLVNPT